MVFRNIYFFHFSKIRAGKSVKQVIKFELPYVIFGLIKSHIVSITIFIFRSATEPSRTALQYCHMLVQYCHMREGEA